MDLPCDWAQFLYICAERGLEDSAIIIIATWHREGPAMTAVLHESWTPGGDLITSILAYRWFEETRNHFRSSYRSDWKTAWE